MSASSFVKSKFGKEAYRQRSYQNSKLRQQYSDVQITLICRGEKGIVFCSKLFVIDKSEWRQIGAFEWMK